MKKSLLCGLLVVAMSFLPWIVQGAFANGPEVRALITNAGTYASGAVYAFFDRAISTCSTTNRIDVAANSPGAKNFLALAMTAFTTNNYVIIHPKWV